MHAFNVDVCAAAVFFTKSYTLLLCGMIFSMGASTLLSTSVNIITPILFMSPGLMMNLFNFTQGVGISGGQNAAAVLQTVSGHGR